MMPPVYHNDLVFSPRYRFLRHVLFWLVHALIWAAFWTFTRNSYGRNLLHQAIWLPVYLLYCYPLMYWVVPRFLLRGRYLSFSLLMVAWLVAGWFINYLFRVYVFIPVQQALNLPDIVMGGWVPGSYLLMTTTAGATVMIVLYNSWVRKQQEWMQAQQEKVTAELQLLKAQVHPHFLFNTLNNIYAFSLEQSPKTPGLILKLSSLLSYMLYDCKSDQVSLDKEIQVMHDYIDLERERYGSKIDISWQVEGDTRGKLIAPLLLLPFLENAFKHGTSEQIGKTWLSVDISVVKSTLRVKVANSKNPQRVGSNHGIGLQNVRKRLDFLYPQRHELRLHDEGEFFVVSLIIVVDNAVPGQEMSPAEPEPVAQNADT